MRLKWSLVLFSFALMSEGIVRPGIGNESDNQRSGIEFFEERIRPVLVERCYACHSGESPTIKGGLRVDSRGALRSGGDSGPAVVPGDVGESLLLRAIEYDGALYNMPPDGKLPDNVIDDFRQWIEEGGIDPRESAPDQGDRAANHEDTKVSPATLWVLQPLSNHALPEVVDRTWARRELDRFILAKLDSHGLAPAPPADRYTLLRRVTFDLTGLPPTPAECESFRHDPTDNAYERVVDRLLASPQFAEHWARHWLDMTSFADLADISGNVVLQGAWRYRDYVIDAINRDKPWNQFIREQIAGDLLPYDSPRQQREQLIATGFLSIGPWTLQNYVKEQLQADVVDHQIDKICQTFLGMTARCARCHDHKFDPISTRDYYAMAGIFHSTLTTRYDGPGVWSQVVARPLPELPDDEALRRYDTSVQAIERQMQTWQHERDAILRDSVQPSAATSKILSATANGLTLNRPIPANQRGTMYRVSFNAGPSTWTDPAQSTSTEDGLLIQILRVDGTVLAHHIHRPGDWQGTDNAQALRATSFTYAGDGTGDVIIHITAEPRHTNRFGGAIDDLVVTDESNSRPLLTETFNGYRPGGPVGIQPDTQLSVHAAGSIDGWTGSGINASHAVDLGGDAQRGHNFALQIFNGTPGTASDPRVAELDKKLGELAARRQLWHFSRPDWTHALAVSDIASPQDAPIYVRGNFRAPGERVPRGVLSSFPPVVESAIPPAASGRKELAEWLIDPRNMVTTRVLANRIWYHVFGAGLVQSVDYFGAHGDPPSHPELLDHLAIRFTTVHAWSLKSMVRELVVSSTYRMSSPHNVAAVEVDPHNRWLWRMNRRRLTAESIRDGLQAISGILDNRRGGPSLGLDIPGNVSGIGDMVNLPTYSGNVVPADIVRRRAIYLPLFRNRPGGELEVLSVFDFPHPNESTGRRAVKQVATQSLFLMNSPFVHERARLTAERLLAAANINGREPAEDKSNVQRMYLLIANRPAETEEVDEAMAFLREYRLSSRDAPDTESARDIDAWTQLCHALIASNAFLFKE